MSLKVGEINTVVSPVNIYIVKRVRQMSAVVLIPTKQNQNRAFKILICVISLFVK